MSNLKKIKNKPWNYIGIWYTQISKIFLFTEICFPYFQKQEKKNITKKKAKKRKGQGVISNI